MLKMRMMFGLIAVVMVLALAQTGYSQLVISATSNPNPTADAVGFNEPAFNPNGGFGGLTITGTILSDAPFTGGRLRITFPSAITNACTAVGTSSTSSGCLSTVNGPGQNLSGLAVNCLVAGTANQCGGGVQLTLADGVFSGASIAAINAQSATIDITLPCTTNNAIALAPTWNPSNPTHIQGATGTMILTGPRIDATTAAGLPAGPAVAALSINTGSTAFGIAAEGTSIGGAPGGGPGGPECAQSALTGGNTGAGANVQLSTSSVNVITTAAQGIGALASGGIPSNVSQPGTGATGTGSTAGVPTSFVAPSGCTSNNSSSSNPGFFINCGTASVFTNKGVPKASASFTVKEGFSAAWYHNDGTEFNGQDLSAGGGITTGDASFQLTFNNVPTGVTLSLAVAAFTGVNGAGAPTLSNTNITTANNTSIIKWGGDLSTTGTDWVTFAITNITVSSSATLTGGSITVSAQMWPTQSTALNLANGTGQAQIWGAASGSTFPAFASNSIAGPTVVNIVSASTTMLIPFAVFQPTLNFDTGVAIANTSLDPFNINTPASSGNVTFTFFPQTAGGSSQPATGAGATVTGVTLTTGPTKVPAGSPGIAADGTVPAGSTWAVNVSQLWSLAGQTGGFEGYIFITANFLPAHGAAYVYNGAGFTSSTPVLLLPPPATAGRTGNGVTGVETLTF